MSDGAGTQDSMSQSASFPPRSPLALDGRSGEIYPQTSPGSWVPRLLLCTASKRAAPCFLEKKQGRNHAGKQSHYTRLKVFSNIDYQYIDSFIDIY